MMKIHHCGRLLRKSAVVAATSAGLVGGLAALPATSYAAGSSSEAAAIAAALKKPTTLTVWAWAPQSKQIVKAFEKRYPKVKVNLVNVGTSTTEYTKLDNAIKAGSGAPDIAQIEYYALPQFSLEGALANLNSYGFSSYKSEFAPAVWDSVDIGGDLVGIPQDTGPMALFYNKTIFDKYGLTVPTTWTQYLADAKKLHAADSSEYMTNDTGDPGFITSMIWDAGGKPYVTKGKANVTINMADAGAKKFEGLWSQMISGGLVDPVTSWSSQWYTGLGNGTIASLVTGGWMGVDLESGVPTGSGQWRVAPIPEWTSGKAATSENGGSSDAILKQSKHQLAAAGFLQFMNIGEGAKISASTGDFPAANPILASKSFLDTAPAYFGGQKINQVLAASAHSVIPGFSYLPFQVYANSIFPDTGGQAYTKNVSLASALNQWAAKSASYGNQQGFHVTNK
jgi:multiple sugar transport system substrate-binding protein